MKLMALSAVTTNHVILKCKKQQKNQNDVIFKTDQ